MKGLEVLQKSSPAVAAKVSGNMGFLDADDLAALVAADPQSEVQVLVRCNGGRFVAPSGHVVHFVKLIENYGKLLEEKYPGQVLPPGIEWVRDVSLLA